MLPPMIANTVLARFRTVGDQSGAGVASLQVSDAVEDAQRDPSRLAQQSGNRSVVESPVQVFDPIVRNAHQVLAN